MGHDKATRETSASAKSSLVKCAVLTPICGALYGPLVDRRRKVT